MNKLSEIYNQILDEGISPIQLYVYSLLLHDERAFYFSDDEMEATIKKVCERYGSIDAEYGVNLEDIIYAVLDGEDTEWEEF